MEQPCTNQVSNCHIRRGPDRSLPTQTERRDTLLR
jgi:hypothetical protein